MKYIVCIFSLLGLGCGVKGDPSPPDKPAEIGRGKPTYKSAMQQVKLAPPAKKNSEGDNDEDDNRENDEQE